MHFCITRERESAKNRLPPPLKAFAPAPKLSSACSRHGASLPVAALMRGTLKRRVVGRSHRSRALAPRGHRKVPPVPCRSTHPLLETAYRRKVLSVPRWSHTPAPEAAPCTFVLMPPLRAAHPPRPPPPTTSPCSERMPLEDAFCKCNALLEIAIIEYQKFCCSWSQSTFCLFKIPFSVEVSLRLIPTAGATARPRGGSAWPR
jgi:hypothetical protein